MDVPDTVSEAVALLESEGFTSELELGPDGVHCATCDVRHAPNALVIRRRFRFEGPTDPADEAVVLGVECPTCGARGVIVSAFGPDADAGLLALVRATVHEPEP